MIGQTCYDKNWTNSLLNKIASNDWGEHVEYLGPKENALEFIYGADVLVLPSRAEAMPRVILEAMALGVPVIGSDIGGHRELIEHNNTGLLFDPDNPQALADTLSSLVNGDIDIKSLITNGRTYVEEVRNWPVSIANYPKVYRSVL